MSMNYRLADVLTRIRNGQQAGLTRVSCQSSKLVRNVLEVLKTEGFIESYEKVVDGNKEFFDVTLKYAEGRRAINEISCISKPGSRVYSSVNQLPKSRNGLGIIILSTSKGVMSDFEARSANVGGELLCSVF